MNFEDLIGFRTEAELEKEARILRDYGIPIDLKNTVDKWLVCSYIYGLEKGLKDYQARSFASEFTLLKTGSIVNTDVNFIYREDWLDSHFYNKSQDFLFENGNEMDDLYWENLLGYMCDFYRSESAWHYERTKHQVNVKLSQKEYAMFLSVAGDKKVDKFITLLKRYDARKEFEFERKGRAETQLTFKMGESLYDLFMNVPATSKSARFFKALYQYWQSEK